MVEIPVGADTLGDRVDPRVGGRVGWSMRLLSCGQPDRCVGGARCRGVEGASRRSIGFLFLRRRRQKAPMTTIASVRRPKVNPTARGTTFDLGAMASVLVGILGGSAAALSARRTLYRSNGRGGS